MDRRLDKLMTRRLRVARGRWLPIPTQARTTAERTVDDAHRAHRLRHGLRLPPTRAARQPRSRGVFFDGTARKPDRSKLRFGDISIAAFAIAVVALASALIVGAPSAVMGATVDDNLGPAIVGAASVPPPFIDATKPH